MKHRGYPGIRGNVEILSYDDDGIPHINISGDSAGLRSLAGLLVALADLDQGKLEDYPDYAREHVHLDPDWQLSLSSHRTIIGRLDSKGSGEFHDQFKPRTKPYCDAT
jgi:hypothetical protein